MKVIFGAVLVVLVMAGFFSLQGAVIALEAKEAKTMEAMQEAGL